MVAATTISTTRLCIQAFNMLTTFNGPCDADKARSQNLRSQYTIIKPSKQRCLRIPVMEVIEISDDVKSSVVDVITPSTRGFRVAVGKTRDKQY